MTRSVDDGATWSTPQDLATQLIPAGWAWDAVGPGIGVKLSTGELVVPAKGRNLIGRGTPGNRTWSMQLLGESNNEGTVAQTPDGRLYRNDRPNSGDYRRVARGTLGGFGAFANDTGLPDPQCEGAVLVYNLDAPARTIFLNFASTSSRREMRVRISYDADANRYTYGRKLGDAPIAGAGKASMTKTTDFRIGALVETDFFEYGSDPRSHRAIVWRRFNLSWILNGPGA
ncbi:exo-alpha-sialidase [Asanoa iriomotensis]|uniref:exo-alpha-sialidase n=1 Tax=Asanoa iriomotensis TaxID=234613 RepID=UPI0031E27914